MAFPLPSSKKTRFGRKIVCFTPNSLTIRFSGATKAITLPIAGTFIYGQIDKKTVLPLRNTVIYTPNPHKMTIMGTLEETLRRPLTMTNTFGTEESRCESAFRLLGPCWHLYTPENHPVILTCEADFKAAMTLLAICAISFPTVRILTFQWMSNHLHITMAGPETDIILMFEMLRKYLGKYLKSRGRAITLSSWNCKLRRTESLNDLRNVIAYNNRNGFLVNPDSTPLTYPWGPNIFFFNPDARKRVDECKGNIHLKDIRELFHTHKLDGFTGVPFLEGIIPSTVFCDIASAERLFRNARHYFSLISRSLESMKSIAGEIGESIIYTDDDLYTAVCGICRDNYGVKHPGLLPAQAKVEVARTMHYEYHAGAKQIARILKVDLSVIRNILPAPCGQQQ